MLEIVLVGHYRAPLLCPAFICESELSNRSLVGHQVELMCVAVLGTMIEDTALVPKLIERRITPAITQVGCEEKTTNCLSNLIRIDRSLIFICSSGGTRYTKPSSPWLVV